MANEYLSGHTLDGLVVPTKAATIYTAQEQSLFLGGNLIPMVNVPAGSQSAQVPVLGEVTATTYTSDPSADLTAQDITNTVATIGVDVYAARSVIRDLGGIDANELGRVLGNSIAKAYDTAVLTALATSLTASTTDSAPVTANSIFDAVAQIRGAGEMGQLVGILSTAQAAELMKDLFEGANFAGGEFQTEALRNGYVGTYAGVQMYQSALVPAAHSGFIFGQDAARLAMQKNVDIEVARRAAAVGNDVVASLHAGVGVVDPTRGVQLIDVA
jgi:hypothetical protein